MRVGREGLPRTEPDHPDVGSGALEERLGDHPVAVVGRGVGELDDLHAEQRRTTATS